MPFAVKGQALGPPESYAIVAHDPGPCKPHDVRIAIQAAGVSFVDVLTARGDYQVKPPLPFIPGSECAGVITAVGSDVSPDRIGERVMASNWGGMFADAITLPAARVHRLPDALSLTEGAVFGVAFATAWHALVQRGALQPGETLLVLGAGGATGHAAVQIGKHLGAQVIASASSAAKRDAALAAGADAAVAAGAPDWRDAVKAANAGKPIDVVFDPISGDATELAFRTLGWRGRHLVIGFAGGPIARLPANLALLKGAALIGVDIRQFGIFEPELAAANIQHLLALAGDGVLRPAIGATYPMAQFAAAMADAANGARAGRIVLTMDSD
jgi:NADPH2:quinone reductase